LLAVKKQLVVTMLFCFITVCELLPEQGSASAMLASKVTAGTTSQQIAAIMLGVNNGW
jgi:hypothetical protein